MSAETNARVAVEVMGLELESRDSHTWGKQVDVADYHLGRACGHCGDFWLECCDPEPETPCETPVRSYGTDIRAAWEVVEKMASDGWTLDLQWKGEGREFSHTAEAYFSRWVDADPQGHHATADTAPMAICLAALQAVTQEVTA